MAEITLYAELPKGADAQQLATDIEKRLAALGAVESVEAQPQSTRMAAELIAGIAITVSIIKGTKDVAVALHEAIPKIKLVLQDLGLLKVKADVAGEQVPLEKLTRAHEQLLS
ncbi:MAG: hypothetical protein C5B51_20650 [Terriglobia bacterium]|nr:MAG: hypothetical protein C5B51_20650 [Terriglobia bacterium]